jgi:hypothetical protein
MSSIVNGFSNTPESLPNFKKFNSSIKDSHQKLFNLTHMEFEVAESVDQYLEEINSHSCKLKLNRFGLPSFSTSFTLSSSKETLKDAEAQILERPLESLSSEKPIYFSARIIEIVSLLCSFLIKFV